MKIGVVGAGAMGSVFGGLLAEAGEEVWLMDIWQEHVDKLNRDGLRIGGVGGDRVVPIKATTDPQSVGQVDLVIIFVKSMHTEAAARSTLPLLGQDTVVLTLQNGLGNVEKIAQIVGRDRVIAGMTQIGATMVGPGHVSQESKRDTAVGELDGPPTQRVEAIATAFNRAGIKTHVVQDVHSAIWGKLVINASINALTAITGLRIGELTQHEGARQLLALLATEAAAVARALSIRLPYDDPAQRVIANCEAAGMYKPSMLQDMEKGRPTEIDAINGAIVQEAQRLGLTAPYNAAMLYLVKTMEETRRDAHQLAPR